ncbi:MAG: diadenylate cyclase, partial [Erysipelotrichaceae bacterium]|nr:diadenylate cyclase [Erysipelotrichaceae bacterium]
LLEKMGKTSVFSRITTLSGNEKEKLVDEIVTATMLLSKNQTGALISIEQGHSLSDYIKTGTPLNSNVTAELLTSIFVTTTPLHDGAVIIQGDKIACASAYFPPTNLELPSKYGARHRAAIGISEITDSITIIVSEETGNVSIAENGQIFSVNRKQLRDYLLRVICGVSTELIGVKADSDVAIAKEFKEEVESGKVKEETSVLDILSIKKQGESTNKIETEAIVSDGEELIVVKDEKEPKTNKNNKKKNKRKGLFGKKVKEEPVAQTAIVEKELDEEEQNIKLPHKKEKPVINSYEEAMSKQRVEQQKAIDEQRRQQRARQQKAKQEADAKAEALRIEAEKAQAAKLAQTENLQPVVETPQVEPQESVIEKPKVQRQPRPKYNRPYESTANIRVMGMDPMAQNAPKQKSEAQASKPDKEQIDTDQIDIGKLMGYENELDNSFEILDKGYQQTKKGGNK